MRNLGYEAFLFADAIFFPLIFIIVALIFGLGSYLDTKNQKITTTKHLKTLCYLASILWICSAFCLTVALTLDLIGISKAMQSEEVSEGFRLIWGISFKVVNILFLCSILLTVLIFFLRFRAYRRRIEC